MQGNLKEIDIRSILQLIELGQRTGVLFVEIDGSDNGKKFGVGNALSSDASSAGCPQSWFVFFLNGQIIYATNGSHLSPLGDYLRHYRINVRLEDIQIAPLEPLNIPEYEYIWVLLQQNIINPVQARSIIQNLISETFFDLLSLYDGRFIFELYPTLTPKLSAWEITPLVTKTVVQLQEWKRLYPFIQSPDRFPVLADITQLQSSLPHTTLNKLQLWADGKTSLRQLSRYLNRSILTVAKAMYPYVQQGWVKFVCSVTNNDTVETQNSIHKVEVNCKARVVCIDGEREIAADVEFTLRQQGYEAIALTDPLAALGQVFQLKPNLIICNTAMSPLDGYEICKMLRNSTVFRFVPIVLLVDAPEHHSRIKAKMMGATDCLATPFGNTELLKLVERYMNYSVIGDNDRGTTLVDPIQYEVKNNITESASLNQTSLSN
ncbi:two-component system response regulator [Scytonema hofmannii PCC 7110]|uniref:Protein PatA n=1 Tax=Scytonema hofmannii PCC 7110 TaxID=128403 RepID=A0A139X6G0_9CYAN|nr:response regulator [Scytonema hofmannii]KYC40264.1 two-component system response regulator [Scytonema hofmannii PCC 7110]